jgi:hypothetical protein
MRGWYFRNKDDASVTEALKDRQLLRKSLPARRRAKIGSCGLPKAEHRLPPLEHGGIFASMHAQIRNYAPRGGVIIT